ncbi:uncharacterized protein LOC144169899 [Haemaphysalis longicornis]
MHTVGAVADLIGEKGSTSPSPTKKAAKAKELPQPVGPALRNTEVKSQTASPQKGTAKRKHSRAGKRLSSEGLPPQRGKKGKQLGPDDSPELNDASFDGSESGSVDGPHASTKFVKGTAVRVDVVSSSKPQGSEKKTVLVGNLPDEIQDEEVWKFFSECGEVEAVRLIRDRASGMGKGFGFVTFKKLDGAALAMEMTGRELSGRPLRVKAYCKPATPFQRSSQPGHAVQKKGKSSKHDPSLEATDFKGSKAERFMKKKKLKKQIRAKKQQKLQKKIFHLGGAPPKKENNKNEAKQSE